VPGQDSSGADSPSFRSRQERPDAAPDVIDDAVHDLVQGELRQRDRDHYLCALFAPPERRRALMALYAFNAETASIRDAVSEPMIAQMRLKWWYDALADMDRGHAPGHPVAEALAEAMAATPLSAEALYPLIEARAEDLAPVQPGDLAALERYGDATAGLVSRLALHILGLGASDGAPDGDIGDVARQLGIAWALTATLKALPTHARQGYFYLPADVCAAEGVSPEVISLVRFGKPSPLGVVVAVRRIAEVARAHMEAARVSRRRLSAETLSAAMPALLPAVLADQYLDRLAAVGFDPADRRLVRSDPGPGALIRLGWNAFRRRY